MRLTAGFLFCVSLLAQTPKIIQGPLVSTVVPRSSQIISWATDIQSTTEIHWAYSPGPLAACSSNPTTCFKNAANQNTPLYIHTWFTGPTTGHTVIYYQVCSQGSSGPLVC